MARTDAGALNEPARRRRQATGAAAATVVVAVLAALIFGRDRSETGPYLYRADVGPLHVHAIAVARDGKTMYVASHFGLYSGVTSGANGARVGTDRDDLTALAVLPGDRGLIASGHANPLRNGPKMLGAIASSDGVHWRALSLSGEAHFSFLRVARNSIYGYEPVKDRLYVSHDGGRSWPERMRAPRDVYDLAVDPENPLVLAATNFRGVYRSHDGGRTWRLQSVLAGLLAWPSGGDLMLVGRKAVYTHSDGAWSRVGPAPEKLPVSLATGPRGEIYAISHRGDELFKSADGGSGWERLED